MSDRRQLNKHPFRGGNATVVLIAATLCIAGRPACGQIGVTSVDSGADVGAAVLSYDWNAEGDFEGWTPNPNINNAAVSGGVLSGDSLGDGSFPEGADPFFSSKFDAADL